MTAEEYMELSGKVRKYGELSSDINLLEFTRKHLENGVTGIKSESGFEDLSDFGSEGFQELVTQKVLEAFDEQICRIKKQMEEL